MKLPVERGGRTRKFVIRTPTPDDVTARFKMYVTTGTDDAGKLREVFIRADRVGSFASGALDAFAVMLSLALQNDVPLDLILEKLRYHSFEPNGLTGDPEFRSCSSAIDLLAQWLGKTYLPPKESA